MTLPEELPSIPANFALKLPRPDFRMKLRFNSIYIVEWLKPGDRKTGEDLADFLRMRRPEVGIQLYRASSGDDVLHALSEVASAVKGGQALPLLHFEAHGGQEALGYYGPGRTASEEVLTWERLRNPLVRINRASKANLIVFSAACWGFGALMAAASGPLPFMAIAGPAVSIGEGSLLRASKEFYRGAIQSDLETTAMELLVSSSARELETPGGLAWNSMLELNYDAFVNGIWLKCDPESIFDSALDIGYSQMVADGTLDISSLPYSSALSALHLRQGRAARASWRRQLLLDSCPENASRFDFDIEKMVRMILDERYLES
jgi:hypothetical protein